MRKARKNLILFCCVWLLGCVKTKLDTNLPVLNTLKASNSSMRVVTFAGENQVNMIVGGFTYNLTPNLQGMFILGPAAYEVTNYNPVSVAIPYKVLDQSGIAHIQLISTIASQSKTVEQDTVLKDDPANPTDYYVFPISQTWGDANYNIVGVPRSTTPPAGVSNIKIRLVNFGSTSDPYHLTGALTLTYADSTPVSNVTTGVPVGVSSVYTEIPYGTYHFRLFTQSGLEVPEVLLPALNTSSASGIHSYQPGGIYTIFVNTNNIYLYTGNSPIPPPSYHLSGNTFTVVPDIPPPANISYGKVQFVNTIPGKICSLRLDNFSIGSSIAYKGVSPYRAISVGDYSVQLLDDQGQTLAQQNITLNPDDNFTVWAYVKDGQPALAVSFNDLTNPNAGQKLRFMNCSVNVPYITFTHDGQLIPSPTGGSYNNYYYPDINDTTSPADATQNLARGVPANHEPFTLVNLGGSGPTYPIVVNQSDAGQPPFVPGITLPSVLPLTAGDFGISTVPYQPGSTSSYGGQGIYSVALTGEVDTTVSGHPRPDTLLIVKHFN